jgi:endonuclease/exonuclease/phosphatase family metal-dependent hydrolase
MGSTQATPAASRGHATTSASAQAQRPAGAAASAGGVRVFSWNLSSDAFVTDPGTFRALVRQARADILLLDEVAPSTNAPQIRAALAGGPANDTDEWHVDFGASGGRQRGVIVSRLPLERLPEFADIVPYPETERRRLGERMAAAQAHPDHSMDGGIPVNGVVVRAGARRLLVLTTDLQCCGNDPGSWEEARRNVEAAELRRRVRQVLERTRIDGIILAGDFNLVSTPTPLVILSGPYGPPHAGLIAAELTHLDGADRWTWDGSGTPFPSRPMDFVLYGPNALTLREGYVLDAADLPGAERDRLGLQPESANRLSAHRPLVAEFAWR